MFALATLPVPVAIGAAILQRRLYDIQLAVNRTLTYTALTVVLAAVYALVVGGVGVVLSDQGAVWLPWAAAGVVAVAFAPLRDALQRTANRVTYGRWAAPAEVLAATGRRLADAADAQALLAALTDELVHGLGLERAELRDGHGRVLASAGAGEAVDSLPLTAYGERVGELRWGGHALRDADRALLTDLSHQLGGVVHTTVLVDDLRTAREQLVLAREQERLRLRRDLHDGLGPSLAGLGLQVDTVQRLLALGHPVDERLVALRAGLAGTVVEVRRIVDGLRPPALDELGLFEAVAELGRELVAGSGLTLELDLPDQRAALPAAVEVATYRVAQEALTNVVRHAHATACRVWARVSPDLLQLEVSDDGCGGATPSGGLGLGTMRERAGEVGGAVEVRQLERGTAVLLRLPLAAGS
jgi:signal transduction histidine kinase